jgi:hypothetical protein
VSFESYISSLWPNAASSTLILGVSSSKGPLPPQLPEPVHRLGVVARIVDSGPADLVSLLSLIFTLVRMQLVTKNVSHHGPNGAPLRSESARPPRRRTHREPAQTRPATDVDMQRTQSTRAP